MESLPMEASAPVLLASKNVCILYMANYTTSDGCPEQEFISSISQPAIAEELAHVSLALAEAEASDSQSMASAWRELDDVCALSDQDSIQRRLERWNEYRQALTRLRHQSAHDHVRRNIIRQRLMVAESFAPAELKKCLTSLCLQIYAEEQQQSLISANDRLSRLAIDIHRKCSLRKQFTLSSEHYFPYIQPPRQYKGILAIYSDGSDRYNRRVASMACDAVSSWFELPSGTVSDIRAYFIQGMVARFGGSVLYLPMLWAVYEDAPRWLLDDRFKKNHGPREVQFSQEWMIGFMDRLAESTIADISSAEHPEMTTLGLKYEEYIQDCMVRYNLCVKK